MWCYVALCGVLWRRLVHTFSRRVDILLRSLHNTMRLYQGTVNTTILFWSWCRCNSVVHGDWRAIINRHLKGRPLQMPWRNRLGYSFTCEVRSFSGARSAHRASLLVDLLLPWLSYNSLSQIDHRWCFYFCGTLSFIYRKPPHLMPEETTIPSGNVPGLILLNMSKENKTFYFLLRHSSASTVFIPLPRYIYIYTHIHLTGSTRRRPAFFSPTFCLYKCEKRELPEDDDAAVVLNHSALLLFSIFDIRLDNKNDTAL